MCRVASVRLFCLLMVLSLSCGCGESEQEKLCKDSQWASKAAWASADTELRELRSWLRQYDVWHLQTRNPNARIADLKKARDKKWTMWVSAAESSKQAEQDAWAQPSKAVFSSRRGVAACEKAATTSPPVQKRGGADASEDEPDDVMVLDWYTPGRRALKVCREAGAAGEQAWLHCEFQEPKTEEEKSLEQKEYSFF